MSIRGRFFDGRSSRGHDAELRVSGGRVSVYVDQQPVVSAVPADALEISMRIGSTPRFVRFPDGGQFETTDHDALERDLLHHRGRAGFVHGLESRWRHLPLALVIVIAFVWWAVAIGVPWTAKVIAFSLPAESNEWIAKGALQVLDAHILKPTTLSEAERARLQARFHAFLAPLRGDDQIEVLFRSGAETIEANALALPSGQIIFTDELVRLAANDDELLAVLAHEVGHLHRRHALRQGIQSSALTLVMVAVVGDVSALSSLAGSLPLLLTQMGYSREFEREADDFAAQALHGQRIDVARFTEILERLAQRHCAQAEAAEPCEPVAADDWRGYWSTHPGTDERIERLRASQAH